MKGNNKIGGNNKKGREKPIDVRVSWPLASKFKKKYEMLINKFKTRNSLMKKN